MAKSSTLTALTINSRSAIGTTSAKAVRREGNIPGVLYGHGGSKAISIDARALSELLSSGGKSHIVDATVDGAKDSVLLREVQRDPITRRVISVDFQRVSMTELITASIGIVTVGVAPGVKDGGGVLDIVTHALDIKGPAGNLPEQLDIDITALNVGDHITAGHVKLPAGFTMVTPAETTVISVEGSRTGSADSAVADADAATAAATATAAAAAPAPAAS